nr:hypothetical protein [Tanacetum cinerariifolium]
MSSPPSSPLSPWSSPLPQIPFPPLPPILSPPSLVLSPAPPPSPIPGGLRADYGFVAIMDREIMRDPERKTEARLSREAWVRSTDASDLVHGEVMSLRTTVMGQMIEIRELHAADRKRQIVISEMLRADHRRSTEIIGLRTALQGQVTALQGQV